MNLARTHLLRLGLLVAFAATAAAQGHFAGWDAIQDARFTFDPDRKVIRNYQPRAAADARELFDRHAALLQDRQVTAALRLLQQIIDEHGASVVQVADERYVGAAELARWRLMQAPPDVRAAYERTAEQNGRDDFVRARDRGDLFALRVVARRYANALVGQQAMLRLAHIHRERGARELAAMHARRLLDFTVAPAPGNEARVAALAAEAQALAALALGFIPAALRGADLAIDVAGERTTLDRLVASAKLPLPPLHGASDEWPTLNGEPARARLAADPNPGLRYESMFTLPVEHPRFEGPRSPLDKVRHAALQPIRLGDRLYVNNTLSVRCFDLLGRSLVWEYASAQAEEPDGFDAVANYLSKNQADDITIAKGLVVGLSAARGLVLANVQVPQQLDIKQHQMYRINDPCRWRGLVALDATHGQVRWEQRALVRSPLSGRLEPADRRGRGDPEGVVSRLDVATPPAIVDDVVYALGHFIEGAVNSYLAALDLTTGETLYTVPLVIGQQELSMFNMPFQEFTSGVPAVANGTIFCPTNLGLMAGVDAVFGDLRWLAGYDAIPIEQPDNYFHNQPRRVLWHNRGPIARDEAVYATPNDSANVHAFAPATGKELWLRPIATSSRAWPSSHLVGVAGGRVLVAASGYVTALDARDGLTLWQYPKGPRRPVELAGTAALSETRVYVPLGDELLVLDAATGSELDHKKWTADVAGNVLPFTDMLVTAGRSSVAVAFDPEDALRELVAERGRRGDSLDLLARIGSLERQAGRLGDAAETLRRALAMEGGAAPDAIVRARAMRCAILREIAAEAERAGDPAAARAALEAAETVADGVDARIEIVRELLARHATDLADPRALDWLERLRGAFGRRGASIPELSPQSTTVGVFAGFELARRHEARGDAERALVELQRIQSDYPSEPLATSDSVTLAQMAIEALLTRSGSALRTRYDKDAESAFASAAASGDADRLGLLLRRFSGAAAAPNYVARELELLRRSGRPAEALALGVELLRVRPGGSFALAAEVELARSALALENGSLARSLIERVARRGADGSLPDDLARVDSGVPPAPTSPTARGTTLEIVNDLELSPNAVVVGGSDRPLRGEPLPADAGGVLLLDDSGTFRAVWLELPEATAKWDVEIPRPRANEQGRSVLHVAGTIIIKRGSELVALDRGDGSLRWQREFEREVPEITAAGGILLATLRMTPPDGRDAEPVELIGLEPRTGTQLFTVRLYGLDSRVGQLVGVGDRCVVSTWGRGGQAAEVFDGITGRRVLDPRHYPAGISVPVLLPDAEVLVLPDARTQSGEVAQGQGVEQLTGWRLETDERAFTFDLLPFDYRLRNVYPVAGGFGVYGGNQPQAAVVLIDGRTGELLGPPVRVPKDISESSTRVPVTEPDSRLRAQAFCDWRQGEPRWRCVLVSAGGEELWRQELDLPKDTVMVQSPTRILRRGETLVFGLKTKAKGRPRTDVVVLDGASGQVLEREGIDGGQPTRPDDLVLSGDFVVLKQYTILHVLEWK